MKAMVTGANGQLGAALVAAAPANIEVAAVTRAECDLADPASIAASVAAYCPDVLINAAAYTAVDRAESEVDLAMRVNGEAVLVMRNALAEHGGRLVQVSTDFVFDGTSNRAYTPEARRNPLSTYGLSKAAGEDAAGPDALIVRTSWVYAAGGGNFVRTMLRLMRERDALNVVQDQIGAPTLASGLAETIWALVATEATGIYHHRDAGVASWYDFAVAIHEEALALGMLTRAIPIRPIPSSAYPVPARRPAFSLLDDSATRALLGDAPPHWRKNLRKMLKEEQTLG
ncbi:MAG: dTDP-4-dehydrorhamnose reductase [Sphingopyxis sp.]|nr:dTDP-4-dehydrorhamnose reductase [Sphingopyxis sp.]